MSDYRDCSWVIQVKSLSIPVLNYLLQFIDDESPPNDPNYGILAYTLKALEECKDEEQRKILLRACNELKKMEDSLNTEIIQAQQFSSLDKSSECPLEHGKSAIEECELKLCIQSICSRTTATEQATNNLNVRTGYLRALAHYLDHADAATLAALCCLYGIGSEISPFKAFFLVQSHQSDTRVKAIMAECYLKGIGIKKNILLGTALLKGAIEAKDSYACVVQGDCYTLGVGVSTKVDLDEAEKFYNLALCAEDIRFDLPLVQCIAQVKLTQLYMTKGDSKRAIELISSPSHFKFNCPYLWLHHGLLLLKISDDNVQVLSEAYSWISRAADTKLQEAALILIQNHLRSFQGTTHSVNIQLNEGHSEVLKHAHTAAEQGSVEASSLLGKMYYLSKSYDLAYEHLRIASSNGFAEAEYFLGEMFKYGHGVQQSDREAFKFFEEAAEQQNVDALLELGQCYQIGQGADIDQRKAFQIYQKVVNELSDQPRPLAKLYLAHCYSKGIGVEQDDWNAQNHYFSAIRSGDEDTLIRCGLLLAMSDCQHYFLVQGGNSLFDCVVKAAEKGHSYAQLYLAELYDEGDIVRHDFQKAFLWYSRSAAGGNLVALCSLGTCFYFGNGTLLNEAEARKCLSSAGAFPEPFKGVDMTRFRRRKLKEAYSVTNSLISLRSPRFSVDTLPISLLSYNLAQLLNPELTLGHLTGDIIPFVVKYHAYILEGIEKSQAAKSLLYVAPVNILAHSFQEEIKVESKEDPSDSISGINTKNVYAKVPSTPEPSLFPKEELSKHLRDIRQYIIYFEAEFFAKLLESSSESQVYLDMISRLTSYLVLEALHQRGVLQNSPTQLPAFLFKQAVYKALSSFKHVLQLWDNERSKLEKVEVKNDKDSAIEMETMTIHEEGLVKDETIFILEVQTCSIRIENTFLSLILPENWLDCDSDFNGILFEGWLIPEATKGIWMLQFASFLRGHTEIGAVRSLDPRVYAGLQKLEIHEKPRTCLRWADISRMKANLFILPLLDETQHFEDRLVDNRGLLKRVYFVKGLVDGIFSSFWMFVTAFIISLIMIQIVEADSLYSMFTIYNSGEKYALTSLLYESSSSHTVLAVVYTVCAFPILWGLWKGYRSVKEVVDDPHDQLAHLLLSLQVESSRYENSHWLVRAIWWDRLRWKLPWYSFRSDLETIIDLFRWDARISAADRVVIFSKILSVHQYRGGQTRAEMSHHITKFADILRVTEKKKNQDYSRVRRNRLPHRASLLHRHSQVEYARWTEEERCVYRSLKHKAVEQVLFMATFPKHRWYSMNKIARITLLQGYLRGRFLSWWIGLSTSIAEFVMFFLFSCFMMALSLLFVFTIVEAVKEYLACPQMKGISFMGRAPYVGKFDAECWNATLTQFGRIPGQPSETLLSAIPSFYFSEATKGSFILDLTGKSLDAAQASEIINGFADQGFSIVKLLLKDNALGDFTVSKPDLLLDFAKALVGVSSTLEFLDIRSCGLGLIPINIDFRPWSEFNNGLSKLTNLKTFLAGNNFFGNTAIEGTTDIGYDDFAFAKALKQLASLEYLDLSVNMIGSCDGFQVMKPDTCIELGKAIGSLSQLITLDLSNNKFVSSNEGVSGMFSYISNPKLKTLDLSGTNMGLMSVRYAAIRTLKRLPALETLILRESFICSCLEDPFNFAVEFSEAMESIGKTLKHLDLVNTGLLGFYSFEISYFFVQAVTSIGKMQKLESLDLSSNYIGFVADSSFEEFLTSIGQLTSLRKIRVLNNFFKYGMWRNIKEKLEALPKFSPSDSTSYFEEPYEIREYIFEMAKSGTAHFHFREKFLSDSSTVSHVILEEAFNTLASLKTPVKSLDFSAIQLGSSTCKDLLVVGRGLQLLAENKKLLDRLSFSDTLISDCHFNPDALEALKQGVIAHNTISHFNVSTYNLMHEKYAEVLAHMIEGLPNLEVYDMSQHVFRSGLSSYENFAKSFSNLKKLKELRIDKIFGEESTEEGIDILVTGIANIKTLTSLHLNNMRGGGILDFLHVIQKIFTIPLKELYLKTNVLGLQQGAESFFVSMSQLKDIRILDLTDNYIGMNRIGEAAALKTIKSFHHLCSLYLGWNYIGFSENSKGLQDIMESLPNLVGYDLRGAAGVDWTEHAAAISATISRDLREKCESRVCRGSSSAVITRPVCSVDISGDRREQLSKIFEPKGYF